MRWFLYAAMLTGLPLVGIWLSDKDIHTYLEFPPLTHYVVHAPFHWGGFCIIAILNLSMLIAMAYLFKSAASRLPAGTASSFHRFPTWGWFGLLIMIAGWIFAWSRFAWFSTMQKHTFTMPWIGYILLANAWSVQRSGSSPLTDSPVRFGLLWPASAVFWWFFEYLNRFVQNWYYVNVEDFGPVGYIGFASLAFATVLPAVLSTQRLLLTWPIFSRGLTDMLPIRTAQPIAVAIAALSASGGGLILMSRYPDYFYPLVWCAPLVIITAVQALWGYPTIFSPLTRGDWRDLISAAVAALICGFFWELWNIHSLAQWRYTIAFVDRFHVFAMPLLGYGGYIPFGLECLVVGQFVMNRPWPPSR
jgi:hypothetical protein